MMLKKLISYYGLSIVNIISIFLVLSVNLLPNYALAKDTLLKHYRYLINSPKQQTIMLHQYINGYFTALYRFNPSQGSAAGFHRYDVALENYSKATIHKEIKQFRHLQQQLDAINPNYLTVDQNGDRKLLLNKIQAQIINLQDIAMWQRDPDFYTSIISNSIFLLISRKYASDEQRMRSVIAREKQIENLLFEARDNLTNPPRIYTEMALEQLPSTIDFFKHAVPSAFPKITDKQLLVEFNSNNQMVINELISYETLLKQTLLPSSQGNFRVGAKNFSRYLRYNEMVTAPIAQLLTMGYQDLHHNQQLLSTTCKKINPYQSQQTVLQELEKNHPQPKELLSVFKNEQNKLQQFIISHHLMTIPPGPAPIVEETPSFARALTFAAMETPGPYDTNNAASFF